MSAPPPPEVLFEFLHAVTRISRDWGEGFAPILRGSLLTYHWYGKRARLPADVDLECFTTAVEPEYDLDEPPYHGEDGMYGPTEGRFGQFGEFVSRVDLGKAMCRYAAGSANYRRPGGESGIRFEDEESPPGDGSSLWVYGTPGKRYYAAWEWVGHRPSSGHLQLDLASPGPYTSDDLDVTEETFTAPGGVTFPAAAYSREAMLAAKVSWLVRGFSRNADGQPVWSGEPKDLFDAHLIACDPTLRPEVFRRAMLAVGTGDALNWNAVDVLFDVHRVTVSDVMFGNWEGFAQQHPKLTRTGPVMLWADLADRLGPLFGDLYPAAEMPLLAAVNTRHDDALPLLVYADWLDERSDPRGELVRLIAGSLVEEGSADPGRVAALVAEASQPWLHQLFGTTARLQLFRESIEAR